MVAAVATKCSLLRDGFSLIIDMKIIFEIGGFIYEN